MQNFKETRLIHCYDLLSFVAEIEKAVKDGFRLDFKDNTRCPVQIGYQLITTMVKEEFSADKLTLNVKVDTTEVKKVITEAIEGLKTLQEASESTQEGAERPQRGCDLASTEEAPKRGRKAKSE